MGLYWTIEQPQLMCRQRVNVLRLEVGGDLNPTLPYLSLLSCSYFLELRPKPGQLKMMERGLLLIPALSVGTSKTHEQQKHHFQSPNLQQLN